MSNEGESCRIGYCGRKPVDQLLLGLRWAFGLWILYLGITKWAGGAASVVNHIAEGFAQTWLPPVLTVATGWMIIVAEPLIGLWLLSGRKQKAAWGTAALLMYILTIGQTITSQFATVANNWQYVVLCLVACAWSEK